MVPRIFPWHTNYVDTCRVTILHTYMYVHTHIQFNNICWPRYFVIIIYIYQHNVNIPYSTIDVCWPCKKPSINIFKCASNDCEHNVKVIESSRVHLLHSKSYVSMFFKGVWKGCIAE